MLMILKTAILLRILTAKLHFKEEFLKFLESNDLEFNGDKFKKVFIKVYTRADIYQLNTPQKIETT